MWNDVWEDGYPEEGQAVYYYFEITGIHKGHYETNFCKEICEGGHLFHCFHNNDGWLCDDVTHWMSVEKGDKLLKNL